MMGFWREFMEKAEPYEMVLLILGLLSGLTALIIAVLLILTLREGINVNELVGLLTATFVYGSTFSYYIKQKAKRDEYKRLTYDYSKGYFELFDKIREKDWDEYRQKQPNKDTLSVNSPLKDKKLKGAWTRQELEWHQKFSMIFGQEFIATYVPEEMIAEPIRPVLVGIPIT